MCFHVLKFLLRIANEPLSDAATAPHHGPGTFADAEAGEGAAETQQALAHSLRVARAAALTHPALLRSYLAEPAPVAPSKTVLGDEDVNGVPVREGEVCEGARAERQLPQHHQAVLDFHITSLVHQCLLCCDDPCTKVGAGSLL